MKEGQTIEGLHIRTKRVRWTMDSLEAIELLDQSDTINNEINDLLQLVKQKVVERDRIREQYLNLRKVARLEPKGC